MTRLLYACFDEVPSFKGASTHVLSVCRTLRSSFDVELITLGENQLPALPGLTHRPVALGEYNVLRRGEAFREHITRSLRERRPDLAHFRSPWEGLPIVRAQIPAVYEVNGFASIELPQAHRVPASVLAVLARWEAECVHGARSIVCPSERIAQCIRERYGPVSAPIHVIPNGYDLPTRLDAPPSSPRSPEPLRLVYLGTLHPWQGLFVALHALAALEASHEACTLDVIAPLHRSFTRHFESLIERRGLRRYVRLLPPTHRGRLAEVLPSYDVGLLPLTRSRRNVEQGCCPIKVLDYLAHGLPVVGSDLFVARELLVDGHNALLVPPNDATALAAALSRLRAEPELLVSLRDGARASLGSHIDWDEHGARVCAVHHDHASSRSSAASVRERSSAAE